MARRQRNDTRRRKTGDADQQSREAIPFGDVVVNLGDERLNRFLRVKIMVAVEETDVKEVTEVLGKQKAFLKSWLIRLLVAISPRWM